MAFLVDPLVEKEIEIAARRVVECALQVLRDDILPAVPRAIEVQRLKKKIVADLAPEHVQDETALLVEMAIEQLDRRAIAVAHDGPAVAMRVFVEVAVAILP